jgi:hypothetical protein
MVMPLLKSEPAHFRAGLGRIHVFNEHIFDGWIENGSFSVLLLKSAKKGFLPQFISHSQREWNRRIDGIQHRILVAFVKYHAVVFLMRTYEKIAEKQVSHDRLDKLTRDPFDAAKRKEGASMDTTMFKDMFSMCFNANIIYYLADYSVHQIIILYGYAVYVQRRRSQIEADPTVKPIHSGAFALSLIKKSALLAFSRGVGCLFSAVGGSLGTLVWPGWGTLCGINLGDSLSYQLGDDVTGPPLD